jgi:hypothetical protein
MPLLGYAFADEAIIFAIAITPRQPLSEDFVDIVAHIDNSRFSLIAAAAIYCIALPFR